MRKIIPLLLLLTTSISIYAQFPSKAEKVFVNGKHLYYEVYGKGAPLILLHGYTLSSRMWSAFVEDFHKEYTIYLVDLTGHGRSDRFTEDLSIESVGADLDALLAYLELTKVKAIGFSFGGDVLFQLAIRNPTIIESMITIGAVGTWNVNNHQNYLKAFTFEQKDNFPWMSAYHSNEQQVRALFEQFKNYRVEVSNEELKSIQADVLLMFGDDDEGVRLQEAFRARQYLSNSDLWILPDQPHSVHEGLHKAYFIKQAKLFFNKN